MTRALQRTCLCTRVPAEGFAPPSPLAYQATAEAWLVIHRLRPRGWGAPLQPAAGSDAERALQVLLAEWSWGLRQVHPVP